MPKGVELEWPSADEMRAGVEKHGSVLGYAEAIGRSDVSVRRAMKRLGVEPPKRRKAVQPMLGTQVSREEILEQENTELRAALRGERRHEVKRERMLVAIERALETAAPPAPLEVNLRGPLPSGDAHHRALLLLSDAHGGEVVKPAAVNYLNAYDWDIMQARHEEILAAAFSHMRRMPPLTGLDLLILGDNCSGANHRELEVTNQFPLATQGIKMGYLLGDFVAKLAGAVPDLRVVSVPGNHPRLTEKPAAKDVDNNMDVVATILAEEVTRRLEHVSWRQPEGAAVFHEIAGRLCYVWHGDGVRSTMPGVPWGGVTRRTNEIARSHARHIDHFILGHFHTANVVQAGRIVMNGSVKGVDEWVLKSFGGGDAPTQLLLTFDERAQRLVTHHYLTPTAGVPQEVA